MRWLAGMLSTILLLLASCKLDPPLYPTPITTYLPVAKGNTWRYAYDVSGSSADTLRMTMTGVQTPLTMGTYYSAECTSLRLPQFTGFYCPGKHVYATLLAAATPGGPVVIQIDYLTDSLTTGQTWTNKLTADGMVNGYPGQMLGTVVEKDVGMRINGKNFRNVIHTRADIQYDFGEGFKTFTTYDYYSAQGVGIIKVITSAGADTVCNQQIIGYSVK